MKATTNNLYRKSVAKTRGRFIFLTIMNGEGAPIIDRCKGMTNRGGIWQGYAIQMNPFRFNKNGRRKEGKCFVIGYILN